MMHSRIDIVVLLDTAFDTICNPLKRLDLEQINFMCITPFFFSAGDKPGQNNINKKDIHSTS
jgi:hypothetical protein